jgi:hypothetical protein
MVGLSDNGRAAGSFSKKSHTWKCLGGATLWLMMKATIQ